jgi:Holliday junction resolvase
MEKATSDNNKSVINEDITALVDLTSRLFDIVSELKERVLFIESRNRYVDKCLDETRDKVSQMVTYEKVDCASFQLFFLTMEGEFYKEYFDVEFKKEKFKNIYIDNDSAINYIAFVDKEDVKDYVSIYTKSTLFDKKSVENVMREGKRCKYSYKAQTLNTFCFGKTRDFWKELSEKLIVNGNYSTVNLGLNEEEQIKLKKIWNKAYNNMNGTESCFVKIFLDV